MASLRTETTEIVTGLGMLGFESLDTKGNFLGLLVVIIAVATGKLIWKQGCTRLKAPGGNAVATGRLIWKQRR